jgi:hypothetical protein
MAVTYENPSQYLTIFAIVADGAGTEAFTPTRGLRVVDVIGYQIAAGGAGDTIQVSNNGAAITNAISQNLGDTLVFRALTVDDTTQIVSAAGPLQVVVAAGAGSNACHLFITCVAG